MFISNLDLPAGQTSATTKGAKGSQKPPFYATNTKGDTKGGRVVRATFCLTRPFDECRLDSLMNPAVLIGWRDNYEEGRPRAALFHSWGC